MGAEPQKAEKNDELVERKGKGVAGREGQREFRRGCGRGLGRGEPEVCWGKLGKHTPEDQPVGSRCRFYLYTDKQGVVLTMWAPSNVGRIS